MIMSSGRSARLPPTPNAPNNKQWVPNNSTAATTTATSVGMNLHEPNSNNLMYQYNNTNTSIPSNMSHHHHQQQQQQHHLHHQMTNIGMAGNSADIIQTTDTGSEGIPGETIDALGPELAVATSKVLESLSENERKMIIEVLNRDENVRQRDATRIM